MGLFTESLASDNKRAGSKCPVGLAIRELDDDDRDTLLAAMSAGSGVPYSKITRGLKAAGYTVGDNAVSRHAAGECSCGQVR